MYIKPLIAEIKLLKNKIISTYFSWGALFVRNCNFKASALMKKYFITFSDFLENVSLYPISFDLKILFIKIKLFKINLVIHLKTVKQYPYNQSNNLNNLVILNNIIELQS